MGSDGFGLAAGVLPQATAASNKTAINGAIATPSLLFIVFPFCMSIFLSPL